MKCDVFFDLLAREASAAEFDAPLLEARVAGADPRVLAELETTKAAALRVRSLLEHRARREAELAALFDTASDLAGLRRLDAVLEAIVRRARRLLGADISYMTLSDDDRGDTCMRVTDGSVSAAFRALRIPFGAGLAGLVAQTGTPYSTPDYFADARFDHQAYIDAAVQEEDLVAILGVPMRLGPRVIGVLFAANRSARPFVPEEIALLGSLAAHAAIAIDNARLLDETRAALEELSAANELIKARSAAVERAAHAHDRMTTLAVRGGGVQDVAEVIIDVLGGALLVLDPEGRPLAAVGDLGEPDDTTVTEAARASRSLGRAVQRGRLWIASIAAGAEVLGTLILRTPGAGELSGSDQRILERGALVTALLLLFRRSVAEAEGRVRGELLDDLLSGRVTDLDALRARARLIGFDLGAPYVLVVVRHDTDRPRAAFWAASYASAARGLFAARGEEIVLLLPGLDPGAVARRAAKDCGAALGTTATAGAAGPVDSATKVTAAHQEAGRCADALLALGRAGQGADTRELGFVGLLLGDGRDVTGFLTATLGPVLDYDERRKTKLVRTLEAYFEVGGSLARAAQRLHVHVNTVTQRLDRVGKLLGEHWQDPERTLELQLALRLHRLTATTGR
ncbi:helix-turn-helix domain-containing protein [Actinoallomurus rhizosphaericola]|uniref:helix-turn-helix domain-containing protein n=1 Tax=Actinoallomurus rhizosphaericola TaxID=2952536 RepID=UPI0020936205|nr:GAF domain-containing protein [Actinoallomurus rhizosphaericola]MCO5997953.1 helix-turn-helix domain-containing protein [Actinoallomurus rhizosphaericola]